MKPQKNNKYVYDPQFKIKERNKNLQPDFRDLNNESYFENLERIDKNNLSLKKQINESKEWTIKHM